MTADPTYYDRLALVLSLACSEKIEIEEINLLSGGASSLTSKIIARRRGDTWPLIMQCRAEREHSDGALSKSAQAQLQQFVYAKALPVAEVIYIFKPEDNLGDGYIMAFCAGENIPTKYLNDSDFESGREKLGAQAAQALATLHAIDIAELTKIPLVAAHPEQLLHNLVTWYDKFELHSPAFELGFAWAKRHTPASRLQKLVHGDFRSGNFLVDATQGLTAVLDWELAHIGDPLEDIGWLCVNSWRFGKWQRAVGGFADRADFYAAYEAVSGTTLDYDALPFWEMYGTLKWGVSCLHLTHQHLTGAVVSIERAAIGRRISEVELDILYRLKHGTL
jgi:aminoglycoside phosphotransferase (APT) family kinase protein